MKKFIFLTLFSCFALQITAQRIPSKLKKIIEDLEDAPDNLDEDAFKAQYKNIPRNGAIIAQPRKFLFS